MESLGLPRERPINDWRPRNFRAIIPPEGQTMKYKIVLKQSEEGYSVSCPGLPGCWSQGKTEEEALANIQDAIQEYLAARDELIKDSDIREIEIAV